MVVDKNAIELLMARQMITQKQLSAASGVSCYTLRLVLRNKKNTSPRTIGKIAWALGVDPEAIVKG
ncbi:helix-turn-helix domain-containing protein [Acidaminococcus massiliensis]|jgi:lambda repressor-like predicted transcriptional regulator|uniref:helix-turn-helix domain-containing protein n=1 Tax=Acidaminococcus massiliensis TaxID=1852375 RepID=UPI00205C78FC|nr:helix-turn-helix transcriptional regulator [Acidaminococcus massiliensis]DAR24841.1 MAG TPA: helix-turn-helix protein [Caudoviricetes sp.]